MEPFSVRAGVDGRFAMGRSWSTRGAKRREAARSRPDARSEKYLLISACVTKCDQR